MVGFWWGFHAPSPLFHRGRSALACRKCLPPTPPTAVFAPPLRSLTPFTPFTPIHSIQSIHVLRLLTPPPSPIPLYYPQGSVRIKQLHPCSRGTGGAGGVGFFGVHVRHDLLL